MNRMYYPHSGALRVVDPIASTVVPHVRKWIIFHCPVEPLANACLLCHVDGCFRDFCAYAVQLEVSLSYFLARVSNIPLTYLMSPAKADKTAVEETVGRLRCSGDSGAAPRRPALVSQEDPRPWRRRAGLQEGTCKSYETTIAENNGPSGS